MPYMERYKDTLYNKEWLYRVYVEENRNAAQVADLIGCTRQAVHHVLKKHGIPVKSIAEAQLLAPHPGSSAFRPRGFLLETVHNKEWMLARLKEGLSYSAIARLAGCSAGCINKAINRLGISKSDPELLNSNKLSRRRKTREYAVNKTATSVGFARRLSRITCQGPCVLCSGLGDEVNHKNRDPFNNDQDNLERLCVHCHKKQHAREKEIMINLLEELGFGYREIYDRARESILLDTDKKEQEL